jgi:hypothetical protein
MSPRSFRAPPSPPVGAFLIALVFRPFPKEQAVPAAV